MNPYGTHQPILMAITNLTRGPVLELGCGDYSTPALHLLCHNRLLVSADTNRAWIERFQDLASPTHELQFIEDWDRLTLRADHWDVIFVDHAPAERRKIDIEKLANRARFLVVHDTEDPAYQYEPILSRFKYRYDYKRYKPWTSIVSNFEPIPTAITGVREEEFDAEQKVLPVYINNRNRLGSLTRLVGWLEQISYVQIIILDNASTWPPLLDWYSNTNHTVLRLDANLGQCSLWVENKFTEDSRQLQFQQPGDWYAYSDSDIVPREDCPPDALLVFKQLMREHPHLYKVGFGLEITDLPDHYPLKQKVIEWESQFWRSGISPRAYAAPIDTTFALHHKQRGTRLCPSLPPPHQGHQMNPSLRTNYPYVARHTPWYVNSECIGEEEQYYMDHASPVSTWSHALRAAVKTGN